MVFEKSKLVGNCLLFAGRLGFYSRQGQRFFHFPQHPVQLWGPSTLLSNGYRGFLSGLKRLEGDTDHSPPTVPTPRTCGEPLSLSLNIFMARCLDTETSLWVLNCQMCRLHFLITVVTAVCYSGEKLWPWQCRPTRKSDGGKSVAWNSSVETYLLKRYIDDDQWRYSPDRALASLMGIMIVCSTMWGYQLHDRPILVTLIQPSKTSSSNYQRLSWRSRETRVRILPSTNRARGVLLHAVNLRHGTDGFTSPPKEGVLRILSPLKNHRPRPGLNPRPWVQWQPLHHRGRLKRYVMQS
jgi:hypothetical protein